MQKSLQSIVFFIVMLYSSYAYLFFFQFTNFGFKPLYWELMTVGLALSVFILKTSASSNIIPVYFGLWIGLFLCNSIICFIYSPQGEVEIEVLIESFKVFALLLSFIILFQVRDSINVAQFALVVVIIISVLLNLVDFFTPIWSKTAGRAAGLYVNPTISGKILVLSMVLSIPLIPSKFRLVYCAIVGLGVLVTFSRGAWLLWVVALIGLTATGYLAIERKVLGTIFMSILTASFIFLLLTGVFLEYLKLTGLLDYMTPNTLARIGGGNASIVDHSTVARAAAIIKAWDVIGQHPWLGLGLAHDRVWDMSIGTHNTYLRMAVEGGIVRLSIFVGFLLSLWKRTDSIGRVALVVYAISCLTSQDNFRQPALLLVLALVCLLKQPESTYPATSLSSDKHESYK